MRKTLSKAIATSAIALTLLGTVAPIMSQNTVQAATMTKHSTRKAVTKDLAYQKSEYARLKKLVDNIQGKANVLHKQINDQQAYVNRLTNDGSQTVIKLPSGMNMSLLRAAATKQQRIDELKRISAQGTGMNHVTTSQTDANNKIQDVRHLTRAQQIEITRFTAGLLNSARQQLGNTRLMPSETAMNFANDVSTEYNKDKWSISAHDDHDVPGIRRVATKYHLHDEGNFYENIGEGFLNYTPSTNMAKLKTAVYNSVIMMLFDDGASNYGHTYSLLGVWDQDIAVGGYKGNTYFGVSTDNLYQDHLELIPTVYSVGRQFNPGQTYQPTTTNQPQWKIDQAQARLSQLKNTLLETQKWFRIAYPKRDTAQRLITVDQNLLKQRLR